MAHRSPQFTLGTLFLLVTGCGVFLMFPKSWVVFAFLMGGTLVAGLNLILVIFLPVFLFAN